MTSPWLTAAHTACSPCSASTFASISRTAASARCCIVAIASPPGKTTEAGWACTAFHSSSLASSAMGRSVQSP